MKRTFALSGGADQPPRRNRLFTPGLLAATAALLAALAAWAASPIQASAQPKLTVTSRGGQVRLQLHGASNQIYQIEASTDLNHWTVLAQRAGGPGAVTITDSQAGQFPRRFYRAVSPSPPAGLGKLGEDGFALDKILVKPKAGVTLSALNLTLGVNVLRVFSAIGNLQVVKVPPGTTASTLIAAYEHSGLAQYAEPDFYVHALAVPDDQYYSWLWAFHNTNQFGGVAGADIDAQDAWNVQHDASNIIVAVVDTGIRYTHEDLAGDLWHNPEENQDGYTNDLYGINVTANGRGDGDPWDDYGHGTHVSGTIGAVGNNGVGVVGVAWHVQLMACKFLDSQGNGTIDGAIQCLDFARSHGAKVVNASWGAANFTSQALHDAIASLRNAGVIVVAAAGNSQENDDDPSQSVYPASYSDLDNIIAVAATDPSDGLASFSAYGATNVDLGAPGVSIGSTYNGSDSDYEYDDGTSMAAAMVSGAVAVMEAHFPDETYSQIKQQILANVDPRPGLQGKCVSGGRLNLYKALTGGAAPQPAVTAGFSANPTSGSAPLTVQFTDSSSGGPTAWDWNFGDGSADSTVQNPSHTYASAGDFTATLTVTGSGGQTSRASRTITVTNGSSSTQPVITLAATTPDAYASGEVPGVVTFHRTGDTNQSYEVYWSFSGTASNGVDYGLNGGPYPTNSPFPAGQSDATLSITPIDHGQTNDETVIVTLMPGAAYQVGASHSATIIIHGHQPSAGPVAGFTAAPTSGQAPLTVQFTDTSSGGPTNWSWDFGDGTTSTSQDPSHTYTSAGDFTATLIVTGSGQTSSASHTITVTNAPAAVTANFAASPSSGQAPLTVQFTDQSSGPVSAWSWDFGDGATSASQDPSHTYSSAGNFTATLTVTGSGGQTSSVSHTITVTNAPAPVTASFAASPTSGEAPLTVQFTDQSSGPVSAWSWDFGDGATSTSQDPSHTYASAGNFTATLTVTGSGGQTSSDSRTIVVTNAPAPVATVTVAASQPLATSLTPGEFSISRTGSTGSALTVDYSLGGSAENGVDYQTLSGVVTIPAGSSTATVTVNPLGLLNVLKTVVLTVSPESTYNVGSPGTATVEIVASLSL